MKAQGRSHGALIQPCSELTPLIPCFTSSGETLEATCDFNSLEREAVTSAGSTHHDEMCNMYMMMWSELPVFLTCGGGGPWNDAPYTNMHGPGDCQSSPREKFLHSPCLLM